MSNKGTLDVRGEVYLHISNSGVTFRVIDLGHGPTVRVTLSSFGNMASTLDIHTDRESLAMLGKMFTDAATGVYSGHYVCKASALK
jgi:hypothetical protein